MKPDLPERLLIFARQHAPVSPERSRLMPLREAILMFRVKRLSYAKIAVALRSHGVMIRASAVGDFCRVHCADSDVERARHHLFANVATAPALTGAPAAALAPASSPSDPAKRRGPRIARDDL
ncbi:MAG: hypothetical protein JNK23_04345 [Opitutaceae bacterium]|nr:hypothetical protein [Opitutaceae bacterium]